MSSNKGKRSPDKVVKKKVGKEPGPARPPKQAQPAVFGLASRESQESLDEKRRRAASERRKQNDYQAFITFTNSLEALPEVSLTNRDLEAELRAAFAPILDSYITLFPEPIKRYLVNTLKVDRGDFEQDTESKYSIRDAVVGYFITHSQADFEKTFSAYITGKKARECSAKNIREISGRSFTPPEYESLLGFMEPVVFEQLPPAIKSDWNTLLKLLGEFKKQKNDYEQQRAALKAKQNIISPSNDVGARRIETILSEVEKNNLVEAVENTKTEALKTLQTLEAINANQVISNISGALYEFFGEHCAPKDLKRP